MWGKPGWGNQVGQTRLGQIRIVCATCAWRAPCCWPARRAELSGRNAPGKPAPSIDRDGQDRFWLAKGVWSPIRVQELGATRSMSTELVDVPSAPWV